jgi:hypothetical protein
LRVGVAPESMLGALIEALDYARDVILEWGFPKEVYEW